MRLWGIQRGAWPRRVATWLAVVAGLLLAPMVQAQAQALRDPTVAPPVVNPRPAGDTAAKAATDTGALSVIVRDGHPYLVVGIRLVGQGEMVGGARLERITESEVWLREGKVLRKLARYPGVQRRVAMVASSGCAAPAKALPPARKGAARASPAHQPQSNPSAPATPSVAAPCAPLQP